MSLKIIIIKLKEWRQGMPIKKWPADYPKEPNVPPEAADSISESLYRIVRNNPPSSIDFAATYKDVHQKHLWKKPSSITKASFYGTSFNRSKEPLAKMLKTHPQKFRTAKVAFGLILHEHGFAEISRNGHVSVWFYDGVIPQGFKIL
jgi:hypothetical protein